MSRREAVRRIEIDRTWLEAQPALEDAISLKVEWLIKRYNRREGMVILFFNMTTLSKRICRGMMGGVRVGVLRIFGNSRV